MSDKPDARSRPDPGPRVWITVLVAVLLALTVLIVAGLFYFVGNRFADSGSHR